MKKESTWEDCINNSSSLRISPDKAKARSLIDTALGRNMYLEENQIKQSNANYIFEGYYTSLVEIVHALVLLAGYKVNNHFCLGYYLRDILENDKLFRLFDDCRYKRNSLMYYGRKMDFNTAKISIEKCHQLINELKKFIDN